MPSLGGITVHLSLARDPALFSDSSAGSTASSGGVGGTIKGVRGGGHPREETAVTQMEEVGTEVGEEGDAVTCFVEVPPLPPAPRPQSIALTGAPPAPLPTKRSSALPLKEAGKGLHYWSVYYRIQDLTYSHEIAVTVDGGAIKISKVHLGKSGPSVPGAAKNTGRIDGVPVTDDWSKWKGLRFEELRGVAGEDDAGEIGEVKVAFYRAGKVKVGGGDKETKEEGKSTAKGVTGFHRSAEDGATASDKVPAGVSHHTTLGPIVFSPPKKVHTVEAVDSVPFVTFVFKYRSRDHLPEDWLLPSAEAAQAAEKEDAEKKAADAEKGEKAEDGAAKADDAKSAKSAKDSGPKRSATTIARQANQWGAGLRKAATTSGKKAQDALAKRKEQQKDKKDKKKEDKDAPAPPAKDGEDGLAAAEKAAEGEKDEGEKKEGEAAAADAEKKE